MYPVLVRTKYLNCSLGLTNDSWRGSILGTVWTKTLFRQFEELMDELETKGTDRGPNTTNSNASAPGRPRQRFLSAETSPEAHGTSQLSGRGTLPLSGTCTLSHGILLQSRIVNPMHHALPLETLSRSWPIRTLPRIRRFVYPILNMEVLCEPAVIRTTMLNMDFAEPEQDGQRRNRRRGTRFARCRC
jgi:hypothetical protein